MRKIVIAIASLAFTAFFAFQAEAAAPAGAQAIRLPVAAVKVHQLSRCARHHCHAHYNHRHRGYSYATNSCGGDCRTMGCYERCYGHCAGPVCYSYYDDDASPTDNLLIGVFSPFVGYED